MEIGITEVAESVFRAYSAFIDAVDNLNKVEQDAGAYLSAVRDRIALANRIDADRIRELENAVKDSPREELRQINAALEKDAGSGKDPAAFWVGYYSGATGTLHNDERSKLRERKRQLEQEFPYTPFSDAERELYELRKKKNAATVEERNALEDFAMDLREAYKAAADADADLRKAYKDLKAESEMLDDLMSGRAVAAREREYSSVLDALRAAG